MLTMRRAVSGVLALGLCGACLIAYGESSDENVSAQEPPATETTQGDDAGVPSDPEGIVAMARRAGERTGDESPTDIEWVYSTREAAVMHVSDTHLAGTADAEVLVVQMQGQFEVTVSHQEQPLEGEEPRPNPTGRALVIVAELESGIITDRVVLPAPVDLSQLGEVMKGLNRPGFVGGS